MRLHQRDGPLGIGRIEGNGEIAILRHLLRVQSGGLLLHCTEWTADGNGGQLAHCILRCVQIRRQRDAVAIVKGHFFVVKPSLGAPMGKTMDAACSAIAFSPVSSPHTSFAIRNAAHAFGQPA